MERRARRELDRERLAGELGRMRRAGARRRDRRSTRSLDRRDDASAATPPEAARARAAGRRCDGRRRLGAPSAGSAGAGDAGRGAARRGPRRARAARAGRPSDSRERSAAGRVTLTSASSSGRRGSPPWRRSSTATASRSQSRTTVASPSWFACARRRSRVSSVTGSESGTSPMCWTSIRCRRCSSRSITSAAEVLALLGELLDEQQGAGRVVVDDQVAESDRARLPRRRRAVAARPGR